MKKKLGVVFEVLGWLLLFFTIVLVLATAIEACLPEVVDIETKMVEGIVTGVQEYKASEQYKIKVEYKGAALWVENKELYDRYKENIGSKIRCVLIIRTLENNEKREELVFNREVYEKSP